MAPAKTGPQRRRLRLVAAGMVSVILAGCGGAADEAGTSGAPATSAATPAPVQGKFDVGGHSLYLSCRGSGSPTAVYLHGAVDNAAAVPHRNGVAFQDLLIDRQRVCLYDRRNVGESDAVEGPQRPADAISDMRKLLAAADVKPPYVLVGASFGGLLAYLYANQHPTEVAGMVLLDAMFPDELTIDRLLDPADRFQAFDQQDETGTPERISHYKVQQAASAYIGKEPAIPVTYLASKQDPYTEEDLPAAWNAQILKLQAAYVDRFSPGKLIEVDAPHFMEPAIPKEIAQAVRDVSARTR
jgi:pimeloyl-ACP methyl ester carboxylesterase